MSACSRSRTRLASTFSAMPASAATVFVSDMARSSQTGCGPSSFLKVISRVNKPEFPLPEAF
jgi:hypothetical protein